jgi:hypothetical protein
MSAVAISTVQAHLQQSEPFCKRWTCGRSAAQKGCHCFVMVDKSPTVICIMQLRPLPSPQRKSLFVCC